MLAPQRADLVLDGLICPPVRVPRSRREVRELSPFLAPPDPPVDGCLRLIDLRGDGPDAPSLLVLEPAPVSPLLHVYVQWSHASHPHRPGSVSHRLWHSSSSAVRKKRKRGNTASKAW